MIISNDDIGGNGGAIERDDGGVVDAATVTTASVGAQFAKGEKGHNEGSEENARE